MFRHTGFRTCWWRFREIYFRGEEKKESRTTRSVAPVVIACRSVCDQTLKAAWCHPEWLYGVWCFVTSWCSSRCSCCQRLKDSYDSIEGQFGCAPQSSNNLQVHLTEKTLNIDMNRKIHTTKTCSKAVEVKSRITLASLQPLTGTFRSNASTYCTLKGYLARTVHQS